MAQNMISFESHNYGMQLGQNFGDVRFNITPVQPAIPPKPASDRPDLIPFERDPDFISSGEQFSSIQARLLCNGPEWHTRIALTGIGGVG